MKTKAFLLMAALVGPVFPLMAENPAGRGQGGSLYETARAAFNQGDYVTAREGFTRLLRAKPDFELARIYLAQIRHAEKQWEARPRSQKIAEVSAVAAVDLGQVRLADALEVVRRELEKSAKGAYEGPIALLTQLPPEALDRPMNLSVRDVPMQTFIDVIAFAGNVRITYHPDGISVREGDGLAKIEPATREAADRMKQTAAGQILPELKFSKVRAEDALAYLRQKADPERGPLIILREPVPDTTVSLELRNVPLSEAVRMVCLISGLEAAWYPWGAGIAPKSAVVLNSGNAAP